MEAAEAVVGAVAGAAEVMAMEVDHRTQVMAVHCHQQLSPQLPAPNQVVHMVPEVDMDMAEAKVMVADLIPQRLSVQPLVAVSLIINSLN